MILPQDLTSTVDAAIKKYKENLAKQLTELVEEGIVPLDASLADVVQKLLGVQTEANKQAIHCVAPCCPMREHTAEMTPEMIRALPNIYERLGEMAWLMHDKQRIKHGLDWSYICKYGDMHILCHEAYKGTIAEYAEKCDITIKVFHTFT